MGELYALRQRLGVVADDERAQVETHKLLERGASGLRSQGLEVGIFDPADELDPVRIKIVIEPGQLQRGPVDVRRIDADGIEVLSGVDDVEILLLNYAFQADGIFFAHHETRLLHILYLLF